LDKKDYPIAVWRNSKGVYVEVEDFECLLENTQEKERSIPNSNRFFFHYLFIKGMIFNYREKMAIQG